MKSFKAWLAVALILVGVLASCASIQRPTPSAAPVSALATPTRMPQTNEYEEQELQVIAGINDWRIENKLPPLKASPILMDSSDWFAEDKVRNGIWYLATVDSLKRDKCERMKYFARLYDKAYRLQTCSEFNAGVTEPFAVVNAIRYSGDRRYERYFLSDAYTQIGVGYFWMRNTLGSVVIDLAKFGTAPPIPTMAPTVRPPDVPMPTVMPRPTPDPRYNIYILPVHG